MDSSQQSSEDFKKYFYNKFKDCFTKLTEFILENSSSSEVKKELSKIKEVMGKINYEKIINKLEKNDKLIETISLFKTKQYDIEIINKFLNNKDKYWMLMPSYDINKIMKSLNSNDKIVVCNSLHNLFICSKSYSKIINEINVSNTNGTEFNPFSSINTNSLFEGVENKTIDVYEMLMEKLLNNELDSKMSEKLSNINENDVNDAAHALTETLCSENFNGSKETSNMLMEMVNNIKSEVIQLGNNKSSNGKENIEKLLGIAQKVAGNMANNIHDKNINISDIWNATSNLAKNTIKSDAFDIVDAIIRNKINENMNNQDDNKNNQDEDFPDVD